MYLAFKTEVGAQMVIQARFAMTGLRDLVAESTSDVMVSLWRFTDVRVHLLRFTDVRVQDYRCESSEFGFIDVRAGGAQNNRQM